MIKKSIHLDKKYHDACRRHQDDSKWSYRIKCCFMVSVWMFQNLNTLERIMPFVDAQSVHMNEDEPSVDETMSSMFALLSLSIVDAMNGDVILPNLIDGDTATIQLTVNDAKPSITRTIVAQTTPDDDGTMEHGAIEFDWDNGNIIRVEGMPPYSLAGMVPSTMATTFTNNETNIPSNIQKRQEPLFNAVSALSIRGEHTLTVRVYQNTRGFDTELMSTSDIRQELQEYIQSVHSNNKRSLLLSYQDGIGSASKAIVPVSELTIKISIVDAVDDEISSVSMFPMQTPSPNTTPTSFVPQDETTATGNTTEDTSAIIGSSNANTGDFVILGELVQYHTISLTLNGPIGSERGGTIPIPNVTRPLNLFLDYRFQIDFYHIETNRTLSIPGHYAADGQAATTSATSGHVWICHFRPDYSGIWTYTIRFKFGENVAILSLSETFDNMNTNEASSSISPTSALFFDGQSGEINITPYTYNNTDTTINSVHNSADSYLNKGPLVVNDTSLDDMAYYFLGNGEVYIPVDVNISSANHILNSNDFDGLDDCGVMVLTNSTTSTIDILLENLSTTSASKELNGTWTTIPRTYWGENKYTGQPKGQTSMHRITQWLLQGINTVTIPILIQYPNHTFISPFVCRHLSSNTDGIDGTGSDNPGFVLPDRTRIDVSKVDQWKLVFDWAEMNGMTLQIQLEDSSTETFFDDIDRTTTVALDPERQLYYREVTSRFGHYLNLVWKVGGNGDSLMIRERMEYLSTIDPYNHPIIE